MTAILSRSLIGFDTFLQSVNRATNYPPYNIIKNGDKYCIEIAATGFSENDLSVKVDQKTLIVTAEETKSLDDNDIVLYNGLAKRNFTRRFALADGIEVVDAFYSSGLLRIYLQKAQPENVAIRTLQVRT